MFVICKIWLYICRSNINKFRPLITMQIEDPLQNTLKNISQTTVANEDLICETILLACIITITCILHVRIMLYIISQTHELNDFPPEAITLISALASYLGGEIIVRKFLDRYLELCSDLLLHVRKVFKLMISSYITSTFTSFNHGICPFQVHVLFRSLDSTNEVQCGFIEILIPISQKISSYEIAYCFSAARVPSRRSAKLLEVRWWNRSSFQFSPNYATTTFGVSERQQFL